MSSSSVPSMNVPLPFFTATLGIALFSGMDVVMKALSINLGAYNACLWRVLAGVVLMGGLYFGRRMPWPSRAAFKVHVLRGANAAAMMFLFFWGITYIPLAEGIALSFIAPLITLYLAAVLLNEQIGARAIGATLLGFFGVIVIVMGRMSGTHDAHSTLGVLAILASAILYAYNLILQRQQAQIAPPIEIAFFNTLVVLVLFGAAAPWWVVVPPLGQVPLILGAAVLASVSILLLSWAYARAEAKVLIPVEYTAFIWAAIFGYLFFHEPVTVRTLIGAGFIIIGCVIAAWQERSHQPCAELGA